MRPSELQRVLRDITAAETVAELRGILDWLERTGALRHPDERTRLVLVRLAQRVRDLADVGSLPDPPD